ncbi:MAG: TlpA disulfide reductase family protein [Nitrosomonas sp.]|nr:TlpA disulfide reductase family protein [Nitrosomonas sp.]
MRYLLTVFALFLVTTITFVSAQTPDFSLKDSTGKTHRLSDYTGKWVLINFWATWCAPCLKEIPDLAALHEARKDVVIIGVAMEFDDPATVMKFVDDLNIPYTIVLGDHEIAGQIDELSMLPSTYLYDPAGNPAARKIGLISRAEIEAFIRAR